MESPVIEAVPNRLRENPEVGPTPGLQVIANRYELGELVGSGGMGEVYAGRDRKLDRAVALKFLRRDMASHADLRSRFEGEARAAGRLSHPNVVGVFDTGEHDGSPFIVMELLSGRTLADEIASGPVAEERARQVGREILSALRASHGQGVLHRDLKPGNVLLCADGSVKVGDFGVAKMAEGMDLTQAGILLGTPAYLAPERIAGEPASEGTDIYSVGVMLYELLAGRKPFDADTPLGLIRAIQDEPVHPLSELRPDVDPALASVIHRAMARDPQVRYSSAAQMEADLARVGVAPQPADETAAMATANSTQVLPVPAEAATEPTLVAAPAPQRPRRGVWERVSARNRMALVGAVLLVALSLLLLRNDVSRSPAESPPAAESSGEELPTPLENALKELEEAVEE